MAFTGGYNTPYIASQFSVTIDGDSFGYVKKVSGGDADSKLATTNQNHGLASKSITSVDYNEATFEVHMALGKSLVNWIKASFDGKPYPKDVVINVGDASGNVQMTKTLYQSYITEVKIPGVEAGKGDNNQYLTIKVKPAWSELKLGGGGKVQATRGASGVGDPKTWTPSQFLFDLKGVDMTAATKIADITWKQAVAPSRTGGLRTKYGLVPGALEVSDITVTAQAQQSKALLDWFHSFVIEGNVGAGKELDGTLSFLSMNQKKILDIDLENVGVSNLKYGDLDSTNKDKLYTVEAKLYVEGFRIRSWG